MSEEDQQNPEKTQEVRPKKVAKVVKYLVILNVIVYAGQYLLWEYFQIDLVEQFALYHYNSENFAVYQFITYMFLHGGLMHIFLNMFILWMFGSSLEYVWNSKKFLFYYFFTGIGAALLHLGVSTYTNNQLQESIDTYAENPSYQNFTNFVSEEIGDLPENVTIQEPVLRKIQKFREDWKENKDSERYKEASVDLLERYQELYLNRPSLGASGAVFGLLLAFGMLFPNIYVYLYFLFPIKAKYFVIFLGVLELYLGVFDQASSVANFAHLGGMVFGFILLKVWGEKPRRVRNS